MKFLFGILASLLLSCLVDSTERQRAISPRLFPKESTQREVENSSNDVTVENVFHRLKDLVSSVDLITDRLQKTSINMKTGVLRQITPEDYATTLRNLTDTSIKILGGLATVKKILSEDDATLTYPVAAIQNDVEITLQTLKDNFSKLYGSIDETEQKLQEITKLSIGAFESHEDYRHELESLKSNLNYLDQFVIDYKVVSGMVDEAHILLRSYPAF